MNHDIIQTLLFHFPNPPPQFKHCRLMSFILFHCRHVQIGSTAGSVGRFSWERTRVEIALALFRFIPQFCVNRVESSHCSLQFTDITEILRNAFGNNMLTSLSTSRLPKISCFWLDPNLIRKNCFFFSKYKYWFLSLSIAKLRWRSSE